MIVVWIVLGLMLLSAWGGFLWWLLPRLSPVRTEKKRAEEPLRGVVESLAVRVAGLEADLKALPSEMAGLRDEAKRAADRSTYHARRLVEERTAREEDRWAAEGEGDGDGDGDATGGAGEGMYAVPARVDQDGVASERAAMREAQLALLQGMH